MVRVDYPLGVVKVIPEGDKLILCREVPKVHVAELLKQVPKVEIEARAPPSQGFPLAAPGIWRLRRSPGAHASLYYIQDTHIH